MSKDNLPKKQIGPRPLWFVALLLLDAFALGGLVAMEFVRQLLESIGNRLITVEAQSDILHVLDQLFPYWLGYIGVSLLLGWITVGAYLWLRTRLRIMIALTLLIPLILLVSIFALRAVSTATSPVPPPSTPTAPAPTQPAATTTSMRVDLAPAQRATMQALAEAVNVPVDQMTKARFVSLAVRAPDNSIQIVNTQVPVDPRPVQITTGLLPQAGVVSGTAYALDFTTQPRAVAMDKDGTRPLDFIRSPSYGLAVLSGDQPRLGWATSPIYVSDLSQLFTSAVDGSQLTTLLTDTATITAPHQWVAQRWSQDGESLYFSTEPSGIGGYILFAGASSLYRVNVNDHSVQEVIPFHVNGGQMICLDELSSDERLVADHCAQTSITIRDLSSGQATTIQPPTDASGFSLVGSARFSPDLTRVAFALAKRDPENEQGWVAVSDSLSGGSKLVVTGKPGEYFTVVAWLNADTLLLQTNSLTCNPTCTSSLWLVKVDGSGLTHITDGTFLTLME